MRLVYHLMWLEYNADKRISFEIKAVYRVHAEVC